jgi:hypothetical protein
MLTKMKIALVIAGSLVCGVAAAQPGNAQGGGKPDFKAKKAAMLQKYDANKDGSLDDKERLVMKDDRVLARFKTLDTDGNGTLSLAEFKAGKHGRMGKHHGRRGMRGKHRGMGRGAAVGNTK